jgi:UPF0755 protein
MALAKPYRRALIGFAGLLAAAVAVIIAGWLYFDDAFDSPNEAEEAQIVQIAPGSGVWQIAETLYAAGVIADPNVFAVGVWREGASAALKAGEYEFPPGTTPRRAMEIVISGKSMEYRLTVPEGLTSAEIGRLLAGAEPLSGEIGSLPPEGALLPETYFFHRGDSRVDLLTRMRAGMAELLAELWPHRAEGLPFETPEDALILASIVEKETAVAAERRQVAGVFVNRLRKGMRLQSDPTVIFAVTGGTGPLDRPLSKADLALKSPFNTYLHKGLPPAPIAHPGRASLEAALDPLVTDALYFVADGNGGHVFAATLEAHNKNVARWRRLQKERAEGEP